MKLAAIGILALAIAAGAYLSQGLRTAYAPVGADATSVWGLKAQAELAVDQLGRTISGQARADSGWVPLASQHEPRQEMAVAELNGRIYAIGGFKPDGTSAKTVEVYDPGADSWQYGAPLPAALNHPLAASVGERIYVIGGHPDSGPEAVDTTYSYDPQPNAWSERARMPTARGALGIAVIDGKIYAAGGAPDRREHDFAVYDPEADAWMPLPAMPTPRNHLAAGAIDGKFYAVGGRSGDIGGITGALEEYDPATGAWTQRTPMPTPRGGIAGVVVDGQLYVFGGEGNRSRPTGVFDQVEAYDPVSDSWRSLPPMDAPRHGIQAAAINNRIYIPGGANVEGFGVVATNQALDVP